MGLFSFLKNVGKKRTPVKTEPTVDELRAQNRALAQDIFDGIKGLNLEIKELSVTVDGDKAVISGVTTTQADKEKAILEAGNTNGIGSVDENITVEEPAPEAKFYEVQRGDSLSKIAKVQYGDAMKYPVIFEANKPMLSDPDKIYPGQVLRIPELQA